MDEKMLDDILLARFIESFYGYGNYNSKFWFVGMEEGGGNSESEIQKRLNVWKTRGYAELEDVKEYHLELGIDRFFNDKPVLEKTWDKIILIILGIEGGSPSIENRKKYQKNVLGTKTGESCLIELLPLPSPGIGKWVYHSISRLPYLENRETYRDFVKKSRIQNIRRRISEYTPRCVVFYGATYKLHWITITNGMTFHPHDMLDFEMAENDDTLFLMIKHPVAAGVTNDYFYDIGRCIKERIT
ncbi:MAG: hypothetical protein JW885_14515 [Deltaproteobacteria bacterium]|nr:hypothetical protein [Candidatus Zymogenaceae bacterium]